MSRIKQKGVSIEFLQDLIKEESNRRRYQEGKEFNIDDKDSLTKETLLRNAVWFGHKHLGLYFILYIKLHKSFF